MFPDLGQEFLAVDSELRFTDPGNVEKLGVGHWLRIGHVPQCGVPEDDVGRYSLSISQAFSESAEFLE